MVRVATNARATLLDESPMALLRDRPSSMPAAGGGWVQGTLNLRARCAARLSQALCGKGSAPSIPATTSCELALALRSLRGTHKMVMRESRTTLMGWGTPSAAGPSCSALNKEPLSGRIGLPARTRRSPSGRSS